MDIHSNTLVFSLSKNHELGDLKITPEIKNFIADLTKVDLDLIERVKDKFITFGQTISKMNGSFVVVSQFFFDENIITVPTLQEAYDYIEMEEMERQLNL